MGGTEGRSLGAGEGRFPGAGEGRSLGAGEGHLMEVERELGEGEDNSITVEK